MTDRLPLARAILGDATWVHGFLSREDINFDSQILKDSVLFDIQVGDDICMERARRNGGRVDLAQELGVIRPPFPSMWVEWGLGESYSEIRCGALILDSTEGNAAGDALEENQVVILVFYSSDVGQGIVCSDAYYVATFNEQGALDLTHPPTWRFADDLEFPDEDHEKYSTQMVSSVLFGLTLMNCRNVTTSNSGSIKMRRSGRQKRQGLKPFEVRYNTIILPGGGSQQVGSGNSIHHRATSLHRVRGHFKTFTAERPLLGKHTGTYWWGWQLRGDPTLGIVESDYRLDQ